MSRLGLGAFVFCFTQKCQPFATLRLCVKQFWFEELLRKVSPTFPILRIGMRGFRREPQREDCK